MSNFCNFLNFEWRKVREISKRCRNCSQGSYSYFDFPLVFFTLFLPFWTLCIHVGGQNISERAVFSFSQKLSIRQVNEYPDLNERSGRKLSQIRHTDFPFKNLLKTQEPPLWRKLLLTKSSIQRAHKCFLGCFWGISSPYPMAIFGDLSNINKLFLMLFFWGRDNRCIEWIYYKSINIWFMVLMTLMTIAELFVARNRVGPRSKFPR